MVTAFAIVCVAIMATKIPRHTLWKAQNGAYLLDSGQLHGSISLPDAMKTVFFLCKLSRPSLASSSGVSTILAARHKNGSIHLRSLAHGTTRRWSTPVMLLNLTSVVFARNLAP